LTLSTNQYEARYYNGLPAGRHQTGDIWTEIPNNGLLPLQRTSAMLITPACDLQNRKSDTFVFVPIVPLHSALRMFGFRSRIEPGVKQSLKIVASDLYEIADFSDTSFRQEVRGRLAVEDIKPSDAIHAERLRQYLDFCECPLEQHDSKLPFLKVNDRTRLLTDIARNSMTTDSHFLPKQRSNTTYPAISTHSVCLFRYLLTFPAELFDTANLSTEESWQAHVKQFRDGRWKEFQDALPVRALRLNHEFLVDAITRLTSLYNRIGSDDFSQSCLENIVTESE